MLNGTIGGTDQNNNPYCYEPVEEAWLDSWMKQENNPCWKETKNSIFRTGLAEEEALQGWV